MKFKTLIAAIALCVTVACETGAQAQSLEDDIKQGHHVMAAATQELLTDLNIQLAHCTDTSRHQDLVIRLNYIRSQLDIINKYWPDPATKKIYREARYWVYKYDRAAIECRFPEGAPELLAKLDKKWKEEQESWAINP